MRREDEDFSAALPFFAGLAAESVGQLLEGAFLQRFPGHAELISQGGKPDFLHVLAEGRVEVFARHRGRETTVDVLSQGASFIMAAVFLDQPYLKSARALTPVRLLLVPAAAVRAVFARDPAFARGCAEELARGYRRLVREVTSLKLRPSLERLANWLLQQAADSGVGQSFTMPFDKKTLAAKLGIAPEVLSRNFAALAGHGVNVNGRTVSVTDMAKLAEFAGPSPLLDGPDA